MRQQRMVGAKDIIHRLRVGQMIQQSHSFYLYPSLFIITIKLALAGTIDDQSDRFLQLQIQYWSIPLRAAGCLWFNSNVQSGNFVSRGQREEMWKQKSPTLLTLLSFILSL